MFFVQIAGRLGKDPETRFTPSGQKVTSFTVATNHRKGKEDVTIWVRVTVWGDRHDKMMSYLKKGSAVIVGGKMNPPSSYTDKEGRSQVSLEITAELIEFSPFGKDERAEQPATGQSSNQSEYGMQSQEESAYQGSSSGYAKAPYSGSASGQGGHSSDDEALPF